MQERLAVAFVDRIEVVIKVSGKDDAALRRRNIGAHDKSDKSIELLPMS